MTIAITEGLTQGGQGDPAGGVGPMGQMPAEALWHRSAPATLRKRWEADVDAAWRAWAKRLSGRVGNKTALAERLSTLGWGLEPDGPTAASLDVISAALAAKTAGGSNLAAKVEAWVESCCESASPPSIGDALTALAWVYALPTLADRLEAEHWWRLLDQLVELVDEAAAFDPNAEASDAADAETVLLHQLLAGEAALVLGGSLPELRPVRGLRKRAVAALSEGLLAMTDGEGLPPARCLPLLPAMLGCWTRCRQVAKASGKRAFDAPATTQYEWLVRQTLRLARPDGRLVLTESPGVPKSLWAAALRFGGDESDETAAALRLRPKPVAPTNEEAPEAAVESEWSGLAVLASSWKPKAQRVAVAYEGDRMKIEASAGGETILAGEWPVTLKMEGADVTTTGAWEQQCWFEDNDSHYLELAIELANGAKLERQVFLAHDLQMLYLSEIVLSRSNEPAAIELASRVPLAGGVDLRGEQETHEGWLVRGDQRLAGAVPLGCPEWRIDPRPGELIAESGALCQTPVVAATNLCCPLLIDLKPSRFAKQRTWRQLTVAEQLERVGPDVAVAYRYQSGREQLVIYRSLAALGNRTFLGQNHSSESVIGRFLATGELDEYFEIEADDD